MPTFIQANLGRHVTAGEFIANVRWLAGKATPGTVLSFNEIDEADTPNEHRDLARHLLGVDWSGWHSREPVGFGSAWEVVSSTVLPGCPGLVRLSPARTITRTEARHNGVPVVHLALHYPRRHPLLASRWKQLRRVHAELVHDEVAQGNTVVWSADVNRLDFVPLHPKERTIARKGLDVIRVIEAPGGAQVEVTASGVHQLSIDGHDAPWARVKLH